MHPLGVNKVLKCTYLKVTVPVTAFVPFFLDYNFILFEEK